MNRGQLKTRVSRIVGIGLGTDDDAIDETALLEELANEAVLDILTRTRVHIRKATATLSSGATDFDLSQGILRIHGLRRGDLLLTEMPREELGGDGFAFAGLSRLTFGAPATTGESLEFWYTPLPSPMTDDAQDPSDPTYGRIPVQHHRAILDYMCWHSSDREGDQASRRGESYRVLYEGQDGQGSLGSDLGRIRTAINLRGGASMVTRRQAVLANERNSSYWTG
jgi:hypothetical protein